MYTPLPQPLLRLLLWVSLLVGSGRLVAQPTGCTSTYTATGTSAGGSAGLYGEYYAGQFHKVAGFAEGSPATFFSTYAGATPVRRVDGTVNFAGGAFNSPTTIVPPATGGGTTAGTPTDFSARHRGSIYLKTGASYTFYLTSDDASYLFLGKEATLAQPTPSNALILNGGDHGDVTVSRTFTAGTTGLYDVQILFAQGFGGATLRLEYAGGPDNLARQVVPQTALCAGPSGTSYASNQAPAATPATNVTIDNNGTATTLNPNLSGSDIDGTVASFQITSLPAAGALRYNGTAITAGQLPYTVAVADVGNLSYLAPNSGTTGNFTFQYRAVDNLGLAGNAVTYTIPVREAGADLATTLSSPATAPQGSLVYFTATTINNGPSNTTGVVTTIQLPAGLTGVSLSSSGTYNTTSGLATFPAYDLAAGQNASRNIAFTMPGTAVNGSATAAGITTLPDPVSGNNTSTSYTAPTQVADVEVAINGPTRVIPNQAIIYTVVGTDLGPSTATGVTLRAQLPANLTGVIVSNGGAYNGSNGQVVWPAVAALTKGDNIAYTVRFNAGNTTGSVSASGSASSTTADGDPVNNNHNGSNAQAQITTQIVSAAATLLCANPGSAGNATITTTPNTYFPGLNTVAAGANSLTVGPALSTGAATALSTGDLVIIMQMQAAVINTNNTDEYGDGINGDNAAAGNLEDASFTAGLYEYAVVQSVSGSTITFSSNLTYGYVSSNASATQGQQRYQVIRIPQYNNLTLGANIVAPRWNGLAGGLVVLDVNGTLDFAGKTIDAVGRGFRGGAGQQLYGAGGIVTTDYRHSNTLNTSANKGEGTAGTPRYVNDDAAFAAYVAAGNTGAPYLDTQASGLLPGTVSDGYPQGDRARGAPGNAGGGGTDGNPGANDQNTGGGGGGNAGRGGQGGNGWDSNSPNGGYGGADFTQATPSRIILGGGGGGGTTNNGTVAPTATYAANANVPANGFASSGAAGGGIVIIRAAALTANAGTINVSGADMNYVPENDGSGGGGAGGSVILLANSSNNNPNSTVLQNITVIANGGKGGSNTGGGSPHGPGGGGGGGIVFSSSKLNAATTSAPGINGTTYGFTAYGSGVGSADAGQAQSGITRADVPNQVAGCPADVVTTLTSSATTAAPGTSVTFTITTVNNGPGTATNVVRTIQLAPNLPAASLTSLPAGATYNPATGLVTLAAIATMNSGTTVTNTITFTMPAQSVTGQAASTSNGDLDPRTANNDGTAPNANVLVTAVTQISGRIFDDVNYGGGSGRTYSTALTSASASGINSIVSSGTRVELYNASGNFVQATTTGPDGVYGFTGVATGAAYTVRVVTSTVKSARDAAAVGVVPVQTFRVQAGTNDVNRVGGERPERADAGANTTNATLASLTTGTSAAESIATVNLGGTPVTGVDFGYNFSTIVNTNDAGPGSLRQFITNANALPRLELNQDPSSNGGPDPALGTETSIFMIPNGTTRPGLANTLTNQLTTVGANQIARITLNTAASGALPSLTASNVTIDGATQTLNVGNTNATTLGTGGTVGTAATALSQVSGPEVELVGTPGQANSERGITLAASSQGVKGLAIYGFGNTASNATGADIYVTAGALNGTTISGNVLGASATSFTDPGAARSTGNGVYLANLNNTSQGQVSATISNNLIGFHGASGIENLASGSLTNLLIQNNEIRSNAQTLATADGVHMGTYGGTVQGNLIVGNRGSGIDAQGTTGNVTIAGNTVSGNGVGTSETPGIRLQGTANAVTSNIIDSNYGAGVMALSTTTTNVISQNSMFSNGTTTGELGIDLLNGTDNTQTGTSTYVSVNANGKTSSSGGNGLLNFPVITQSVVTNTTSGFLEVTGYAPAGALVELFVADKTTAAFGQGKVYLTAVTENTAGDLDSKLGSYSGIINGLDQGSETNARRFFFRIPVSSLTGAQLTALTAANARLTATATVTTSGNASTSEFSGSAPVQLNRPLPVTLVSFTAQASGADAELNWRTAQELNNHHFVVERSLTGSAFEALGQVAGSGTSTQPRSYTFTDPNVGRVAAGRVIYYRLRQVDTDGTEALTQVQAVRFGTTVMPVVAWPSPTAADASLDLTSLPAGTYQAQVLDVAGRLVYTSSVLGSQQNPLPAAQWPRGSYLIRVTGAGAVYVTRLVKQ